MNDTQDGGAGFPRRVIDRGHSQARSLFIGSAIDDAGLDVYEFCLYAHLKRRAQDGEVWERQDQMARICRMSRKTVNEVLQRLAEKGWIQQENRTHKGQRTSNLICLLEPPCNPQLHGQVTQSYTAVSPTVTAKGTPHQGSPNQGKEHVISPDGEARDPLTSRAEESGQEQTPHALSGSVETAGKGSRQGSATSVEKVPGGAAALLDLWNEHCGPLPKAEVMTKARATALNALSKAFGDAAPALLTDAAREVASDAFWKERRYGLDNLLRGKVPAKAEAWRARKPSSLSKRRNYD